MRIEIRKITNDKRSGTFAADIWIDGRKAGEVVNYADGNDNVYNFPDYSLLSRFRAYCETLTPWPAEAGHEEMSMDADLYVGIVSDRITTAKSLDRILKKSTGFILAGSKRGEYHTINRPHSPAVEADLAAKHGSRLRLVINGNLEAALDILCGVVPTPRTELVAVATN